MHGLDQHCTNVIQMFTGTGLLGVQKIPDLVL